MNRGLFFTIARSTVTLRIGRNNERFQAWCWICVKEYMPVETIQQQYLNTDLMQKHKLSGPYHHKLFEWCNANL